MSCYDFVKFRQMCTKFGT